MEVDDVSKIAVKFARTSNAEIEIMFKQEGCVVCTHV